MSNRRRLLLLAASLFFVGSSDAQVVYPQSLDGCLDASADGWDHCVTIYPTEMCDNTYDIHVRLCQLQYPE